MTSQLILLLLLLVSFLGTCGTVFYILAKHTGERKTSISLHVAATKKSHALFAAGHFIGGLCFLIFCYKFFYVDNGSTLLLVLAALGFLVEQVQAFLPNNERFEMVHTIAAFGMGLCMIVILALAPSVVELNGLWLFAYVCLAIVYLSAAIYALLNKQKFYQAQVVFFSAFYIFLFILLYGGQ